MAKNGSIEEPHDDVTNPHHYVDTKISPMDYIEAAGLARGFCLGCAIKYISRAGKKEGQSEAKDLGKANWYLNRWRDYLKNEGSPVESVEEIQKAAAIELGEEQVLESTPENSVDSPS